MDTSEFTAIMKNAQAFFDKDLNEEQTGEWLRIFGNDRGPTFARAMAIYRERNTNGRFPMPGQIREVWGDAYKEALPPKSEEAIALTESEKREWGLAARITGEVVLHHQLGLAKKQDTTIDVGYFDLDTWRNTGKAKTWSPLMDWYLGGLADLWHKGSEVRVLYMQKALEMLQERRGGREPKIDADTLGAIPVAVAMSDNSKVRRPYKDEDGGEDWQS